ncbi:hypothetical protein [Halorubellus salinus]|uniref:hypothetical protein n=1 Tax=Halorubellus salinus TaxID=755309 RepID=UPI001D071F01|nr:hypothetical protein [Halorubellus salinus]
MAKAYEVAEKNRVDKKLVTAHERVLEEWSDEQVTELSEIVREEPMYQPLDPTPTEAAFYFRREQVKSEVEMRPVKLKLDKYLAPVTIDYEPAE